MTDFLAIVGVAVLFVILGLFYRHRSCPDKKEDGSCADTCSVRVASCPINSPSESHHAHS